LRQQYRDAFKELAVTHSSTVHALYHADAQNLTEQLEALNLEWETAFKLMELAYFILLCIRCQRFAKWWTPLTKSERRSERLRKDRKHTRSLWP
jgi:hypothetical protein